MDAPKKRKLKIFGQCINHHKNAQGQFSNKKDEEGEQPQKELAAPCLTAAWTVSSEGTDTGVSPRQRRGFRAVASCQAMH